MKDYLNYVYENYAVRNTDVQKKDFRLFLVNEISDNSKYNTKIECLNKKHNNVIVGDIEKAKIVFSAHYDTPFRSLWPNFVMPRRKIVSILYHLAFPLLIAIISLFVSFLFNLCIDGDTFHLLFMYLLIYFIFIIFAFKLVINKNNKNDNTSGIACILSLINKFYDNEDVCFVFFDNEEKGLLGSKAFQKKYKKILNDKLIINFDCVGEGNNVLLIHKNDKEFFDLIEKNVKSNELYNVFNYPLNGSFGNSDYKSFKKSLGVMTCLNSKYGLYTSKIHTNKDVYSDNENIDFIVNSFFEIGKDL